MTRGELEKEIDNALNEVSVHMSSDGKTIGFDYQGFDRAKQQLLALYPTWQPDSDINAAYRKGFRDGIVHQTSEQVTPPQTIIIESSDQPSGYRVPLG